MESNPYDKKYRKTWIPNIRNVSALHTKELCSIDLDLEYGLHPLLDYMCTEYEWWVYVAICMRIAVGRVAAIVL